jgi:hypothetical protein
LLATNPHECGSLLPPPRTPGNETALQLLCNLGKGMRGKTKRAKPSTDSFTQNHHTISISLVK